MHRLLLGVKVVVANNVEYSLSLAGSGYPTRRPQSYIVGVHVDEKAHARKARPFFVKRHLQEPAARPRTENWDEPVGLDDHPLCETRELLPHLFAPGHSMRENSLDTSKTSVSPGAVLVLEELFD